MPDQTHTQDHTADQQTVNTHGHKPDDTPQGRELQALIHLGQQIAKNTNLTLTHATPWNLTLSLPDPLGKPSQTKTISIQVATTRDWSIHPQWPSHPLLGTYTSPDLRPIAIPKNTTGTPLLTELTMRPNTVSDNITQTIGPILHTYNKLYDEKLAELNKDLADLNSKRDTLNSLLAILQANPIPQDEIPLEAPVHKHHVHEIRLRGEQHLIDLAIHGLPKAYAATLLTQLATTFPEDNDED